MKSLRVFAEVWAVDFEFTAPAGERPTPLCVVARELRSGRLVRLWLADGARPGLPTQPARNLCSWPTMLRPNWVVTWRWSGRRQPEFSTCMPNSAASRPV